MLLEYIYQVLFENVVKWLNHCCWLVLLFIFLILCHRLVKFTTSDCEINWSSRGACFLVSKTKLTSSYMHNGQSAIEQENPKRCFMEDCTGNHRVQESQIIIIFLPTKSLIIMRVNPKSHASFI